ncbi:lytic murein transglycosylase [Leucobacter sp. CSA1]|uniref:Lytic murein transglycosylase n=2 Tax=Leucobacter chromiisoli TaxID=2796471 RepID=A0A934Q679_9MICO|nr:lytic murein transglycosylase [Leucobacter chromiisoli]
MRAYAGAAVHMSTEQPGCGIGWNTLAGIGWVESEHGTIDGGSIAGNGRASPPIVGIPLDGTSTDRIHDTDEGALDGDPVWDRAVGPMQFIPSTWATWGADGNGDGIEDPQHIDDSALAAARYLCEVGGDLRQPENWIAAVAAYNDTVEYNNRVADAADHYASVG